MTKPYITIKHLILEGVAYALIVANLIFGFIFAATRDGEIAINYNGSTPTEYGSPYTLLYLPAIFLGLNILISLIMHFAPSWLYRLPFKIKPGKENEVMYIAALMMPIEMIILNAWALFFAVIWAMGYGALMVPSGYVLLAILIPTAIVFTILAYKHNR